MVMGIELGSSASTVNLSLFTFCMCDLDNEETGSLKGLISDRDSNSGRRWRKKKIRAQGFSRHSAQSFLELL